jgi:hypothetical protein
VRPFAKFFFLFVNSVSLKALLLSIDIGIVGCFFFTHALIFVQTTILTAKTPFRSSFTAR